MDEYFNIVDKDGESTGEKKLRALVHRDGDLHKAVHIWIQDSKGNLLLQKRGPNRDTYPNHWTFSVGGHVKPGKTSLETAQRETQEELGLNITEDKFKHLFSVINSYIDPFTGAHDNEYNDVYLVEQDIDPKEIKFQKEEITKVKLFNYKELEQLINNRKIKITPQYKEYEMLFRYLNSK